MPLFLEIVSKHREIVGDDAVREFSDDGGIIGRSFRSDWILPDPDRYISSKHAAIDVRSGIYYLVDLSSNGVFINDERTPLGKGNSQRLFNGDRLRLGEFEIAVSITDGESISMPMEGDQTELPEPIELSVEEDRIQSGIKFLDEDEIAGESLGAMLFDGDDADIPELSVDDLADNISVADDNIPTLDPSPVPSGPGFDAFLEGLGMTKDDLGKHVDPEAVLRHAGQVLREYTEGVAGLLASRAGLKTAFRLDQTMLLPKQNNPIKLSEEADDSIRQLLVGRDPKQLPPQKAAREVCRDLLFHQDAFLDAMTAAFADFARRFDPEELLSTFGDGGRAVFGIGSAKKNWELYCDIYPAITETAGGRFPQLFAEEFVKHYENQIAEFKRLHPDDEGLRSTRKLDHSALAKGATGGRSKRRQAR